MKQPVLYSQVSLFTEVLRQFEAIHLPDGQLRYAAHFYEHGEAQAMFDALLEQTPWRQDSISIYGKRHAQPRLSAWYGDADALYSYSGIQLVPLAWTPLLAQIRSDIESATGQFFNSVLLNYYRDGHDGMGWHSDDETSLGMNPVIVSLSLGATRRFQLRHRDHHQLKQEIGLVTGSVLIMEAATQHHWQHCVPKESSSIGPRINLTFRRIL